MIKIEDSASNSFTSHYKTNLTLFFVRFSNRNYIIQNEEYISRKTIPKDVIMGAKDQCNCFTILLVFIVAKFDYSI